MPGIKPEIARERKLLWIVEFLSGDPQCRDGHTRRYALRPHDGIILDRHQERISLQLEPHLEFYTLFIEGENHIIAQVIVRRPQREPRNFAVDWCLGPETVLHGLSGAEKIRDTAVISCT